MRPRKSSRKEQPSLICRLCRSALEQTEDGLICPSCLVVWHGDTFEPLEEDPSGLSSDYYFRFGMGC
jgi:hypothetical protein